MQHFIIKQDISGKSLDIREADLLHQMKSVLRFKAGDECVILDGSGKKAKGEILELHKKGAKINLSDHETCSPPKRRLRLYSAISKKPSTFEMIVQKATELRVTEIIPLVTERCQVKELRKLERLELIIKEACEQSENCFAPTLSPAISLKDLLATPPSGELLAGDPWNFDQKLSSLEVVGDINLIIGPEGGLTHTELDGIRSAGGLIFQLGESVLRMETAAIAALSVIQFGR